MRYPEKARDAAKRSALYWLLAEAVLRPPAAHSLRQWCNSISAMDDCGDDEAMVEHLRSLIAELPSELSDANADALGAEHARLFGGLKAGYGLPPPLESVARQTAVSTDRVVAVNNAYIICATINEMVNAEQLKFTKRPACQKGKTLSPYPG